MSGWLAGTSVTAPMMFVTAGLVLGEGGLGWLTGTTDEGGVRILAETTLVLVLFTNAVRIRIVALRREYQFPARLLGVGMPLGVVFGTAAALLLFDDFDVWEAALLAAVLVPTDAALGAAVVSDWRLHVRVRQTLNVESGLNDGIALPIVLLMVALTASSEGLEGSARYWVGFTVRRIGLGAIAGRARLRPAPDRRPGLVDETHLLPVSDAALGPAPAHCPRLDRRALLPTRHHEGRATGGA